VKIFKVLNTLKVERWVGKRKARERVRPECAEVVVFAEGDW